MTGEPTYIELGVPDPDVARAFYGPLLGWEPTTPSGPGSVDTPTLGVGIHGNDPSSVFEVFFAVDELDRALSQVIALGGNTDGVIHESPGFGRWAECDDNQGVRFGLRQPYPDRAHPADPDS